ncbi:ABC transporter substrate-binding protein [Vibrio sp. V27_P1S3P104]|uniref:ABC transporter substrate-binding protein n=2 Tax=unclassified Vibrio TaxID=2614977 RepID=UPI001373325A|nr:ABC transporter substrate-binding protein [Vibrio sp. V27_P1S3P104]NAX36815.1 ABC transporter substrate-binding protein [Vibrio sp. V27_P1S3P104]
MIKFWNGNKTTGRQHYELALMHQLFSPKMIINDTRDYPNPDDEANIFNNGTHMIVTVAGNQKFINHSFLSIDPPICKGTLGCRVLIVRKDDIPSFHPVNRKMLEKKTAGFPATWADAEIFRRNHLPVLEYGDLRTILNLLLDHQCDYISLGITEAQSVIDQYPEIKPKLIILKDVLLYYPLPLIFYLSPSMDKDMKNINNRWNSLRKSEKFDQIFNQHYPTTMQQLQTNIWKVIYLNNPFIPSQYADFRCDFLAEYTPHS